MAEEKNIATGYIGNALRSTAADHIATFADEVFDTDRQQYQNEVNSIVGSYIENPEFLYVKKDADDRLIWWIYPDGSVDWAKGVPAPIKEELKKLEQLIKDNTEGDESVVARVTANEESIVAINEALDRKVDGVYEDSPEYVRLNKDADERILNGIKTDGTNYLPKADIDTLSLEGKEVDNDSVLAHKYIESPEFIKYYCDADGRLLWWIYPDGSVDWAKGVPAPIKVELRRLEQLISESDSSITEQIEAINKYLDETIGYKESHEYIKVEKDADERIINAITTDGTNYLPKANVDKLSLDGEDVDNDALKSQTFEECQEFVNVIKDSDDKILFGIDNNGDIISEYLNKIKKAIPNKEGFVLKSDIDYNTFAKKILDSKTMEFATLFPKSGECESFLFFTDPHLGGANNNFDIDTFYEAMGVVKKYFDATPTSFVLSGGDWLNYEDYQANACGKLGFIDAYMNSHFNSYFPIFGNHDCNYQGIVSADDDSNGNLGNQVLSNLMFRKWGRKYYTFKESITRFYIFDTGIDWNNAMTGEWVEGNYRWEQIEWFANQLIENNDTHIALGMHIISTGNVENWQNGKSEFFKNVIAIAKAFNNKSSTTLNEHSYDFTGKEGTIHFVIAGHSHFDYVDESEGIPIIITTKMYKPSVVNFDLIICDYSNHKLHTIRIGYGNNRSITIK